MRLKIAMTLFAISSLLTAVGKRVVGGNPDFVFPLPLSGWGFVVNRVYRQKVTDYFVKDGKPLLKNCLDYETWPMPPEWYEDMKAFVRHA